MLRAVAGHPSGANLAAVGYELPQQTGVLVVDVGDLLLTEHADLLLRLAYGGLGHRGAPGVSAAPSGRGWSLSRRGVRRSSRRSWTRRRTSHPRTRLRHPA